MYDILNRHAAHVLNEAGLSLRKIARQTKMSVRTVSRILQESPVAEIATPANPDRATPVGRPAVVNAFEDDVKAILSEEPDLLTVEILHRLRQKGYAGSKSPLYELVARLRPAPAAPLVRFEGLAGEFSQHDFGHVRVRYADGSTEILHFFASRLKYSRWSHVALVTDESVESLVRALLKGFESFGGVPLVAVFDNPKTIVTSRAGDHVEWNPTFGQVALDFRFAPELCTPGLANQKGSVENLVGWVKNSFFKVRRFHDHVDLVEQLGAWHTEVNTERPSRATRVIPARRLEEERSRLRPLVFAPNDYALRFPIFVGATGWVEFRGVRYSMPPKAIHMAGTLFLYPDRVKIVAGPYEARHPRIPIHGKICTQPEHTAQGLAAVSGKRAKLYYQRQRLLELGAEAEAFLTELIHARQRTWMYDVERLFEALQRFGPERLLVALQRAYAKKWFGSEYVIELLQEKVA